MKSLVFAIGFILVGPLAADLLIICDLPRIGFEARADALYWRACTEGLAYGYYQATTATASLETANTETLELQPDPGWGFRLMATARDCDAMRFLELEWVYFNHTDQVTARANASKGTLFTLSPASAFSDNTVGAITVNQRDRYNKVTLLVGQTFLQACGGELYGFLGGGWREIDVRSRFSYSNSDSVSELQRLRFSGGAICMGLGATSGLGCGFQVETRLGLIFALGDLGFSFSAEGFNNGIFGIAEANQPSSTCCIPAIEGRIAVSYQRAYGSVGWKAEIGYQFDYYFDLLNKELATDVANPAEAANRGYAGPFAGISASF